MGVRMTLSPDRYEDMGTFPRFCDDDREVLIFDDYPKLTDSWSEPLRTSTGVWVRVARADCGLGCRCAGVYRVEPIRQ